MFVTLEPCAHTGRTPPCTDAIIEAGINKVVVAAKDPNPLVSGRGLRQLKVRGVTVRTGLLAREAALVNEDFFWSVINRRPWVSLKLAMTLDGRIADFQGGSKWITSPAARREVQEIRRRHGAVAVGGGTLAADDPKLTARCGNKNYYPARIVFSTGGDIPKNCYFRTRSSETRSIVVIKGCGERRIDRDRHGPIEYWHTGAGDDAETISAFLDMAYAEGLASILVEGGQRLASSFLENGFVNKVYLFYGNKIFGNGKNGLLFSQGLSVANSINLSKVNRHYFGGDFLVSGYVGRADSAL
jgi:diaminohydroxyphosphoribosylaminopyrimidine deaminase/5-amino-6-(5-phosphoribosylamino)uracil reductase